MTFFSAIFRNFALSNDKINNEIFIKNLKVK